MYRWIILLALVFTAQSAAIHNHQKQDHQSLYSQLHAQQQQRQDSLITPLKLQYVAPKAFLTSAGLVSGQQVLTTANPQLVSVVNQQPLVTETPRHLSVSNPQLLATNLERVSARNFQVYPVQSQQQLPTINQQFTSNTEVISQRSHQHLPTIDSQILPIVNPALYTNSEFISPRNPQVAADNQQYISPTVNPQQLTGNQQLFAANQQLISPRNPQFVSTVSPQLPDTPQLIQPQNLASVLPLIYSVQTPIDNYSGQQRYNRLPSNNNVLPELQFADPRVNRVLIPNSQITSLLNALYQPNYFLMAMPPTSYTAVSYYDDSNNNDQEVNAVQSDSPQPENNEDNERTNSNGNAVQRSSSDTVPQSDSSGDFSETANDNDILKVSYKDSHVKYSY